MAKENQKKNRRVKFTPPRARVGRYLFVVDTMGEVVSGLSFDTGNGYYYFASWKRENDVKLGKKTRKDYEFGTDYDQAIFEYSQWKSEREGGERIQIDNIEESHVEVLEKKIRKITNEQVDMLKREAKDFGFDTSDITDEIDVTGSATPIFWDEIDKKVETQTKKILTIAEQYFWEKARQLAFTDIITFSDKIGIPEFRSFKNIKIERKVHMNDVLEFYLNVQKPSPHEIAVVKTAWREFVEITGIVYFNDIVQKTIDDYVAIMFDRKEGMESKSGNYKDTWLHNRFDRVKRVIKKNKEKNRALTQTADEVYIYCRDMIHATGEKEEKIRATKEQIHTIYKKADDRTKLWILLSLNCAYHAIDLADLKKNSLREFTHNGRKYHYIYFPRRKTRRQHKRINILWQETYDMLTDYIKLDRKNKTNFVFINHYGKPYATSQRIRKPLDDIVKELNNDNLMPPASDGSIIVSFKRLRRSAATALSHHERIPVELGNLTLGEKLSNNSKSFYSYVESKPSMCIKVAEIIRKEYDIDNLLK